MLNGTLKKITLCKSRPAPGCCNAFEAMLHSELFAAIAPFSGYRFAAD